MKDKKLHPSLKNVTQITARRRQEVKGRLPLCRWWLSFLPSFREGRKFNSQNPVDPVRKPKISLLSF
jgi:hypothetical protein